MGHMLRDSHGQWPGRGLSLLRNTKDETETINVKTEPAVTGKCLDTFSAVKRSRMHGVS